MLMDNRGSGKIVATNLSGLNDKTIAYTVPEGRSFVGKIISGSPNSSGILSIRVNGVVIPCGGLSSSGPFVTVIEVNWPANTVISATSASSGVAIMGNEL